MIAKALGGRTMIMIMIIILMITMMMAMVMMMMTMIVIAKVLGGKNPTLRKEWLGQEKAIWRTLEPLRAPLWRGELSDK